MIAFSGLGMFWLRAFCEPAFPQGTHVVVDTRVERQGTLLGFNTESEIIEFSTRSEAETFRNLLTRASMATWNGKRLSIDENIRFSKPSLSIGYYPGATVNFVPIHRPYYFIKVTYSFTEPTKSSGWMTTYSLVFLDHQGQVMCHAPAPFKLKFW